MTFQAPEGGWRSESERTNQRTHALTAKTQEVRDKYGDLIDAGPVDPARREACRTDFLLFCKTYGAELFNLPWSTAHIEAASRIEAAVHGELFALAMPRGSGKTSFARWAALWAIAYGYSPYVVLICKTMSSAKRMLKSIKTTLQFSEILLQDFPEMMAPFKHIKGQPRACQGQKYNGEPTGIQWSAEQVIFAKVPGAACSESIIDVVGIEGDIRGRQFERQDGSVVRPTFVVVDDPQDRESARSPQACDQREQTIKGDIRYLSGPGKPTGVVMPCTVIYKDDLAERMLDPQRNPEWHGLRTKFLLARPGSSSNDADSRAINALWDEYFAIRRKDFQDGGNGSVATDFYRKNRVKMDTGAATSWPERFFTDAQEISAIQHAMNRIDEGEEAFQAEYQNEPIDAAEKSLDALTLDLLRERIGTVERGVVAPHMDTLTAFIDVSKKVLWWAVVGWNNKSFTGQLIDYGVFPEQRGTYVTLSTVRKTLQNQSKQSAEKSLEWGLEELGELILGRDYVDETGLVHKVAKCLIDTNWQESTPVVNAYCNRSRFSSILLPSRGHGVVSPGDGLLKDSDPRPGTKMGLRWKTLRSKAKQNYCLFDSNFWKTFISNRIKTNPGSEGSLTGGFQFPASKSGHRMLFEQITSEAAGRKIVAGMTFDMWRQLPARPDNHLLDCLVGCAVAASILGVSLPSHSQPVPTRIRPRLEATF